MLAYSSNGVLEKVAGDPSHGYTNGKLCAKGYSYINRVYSPKRLKYPIYQTKRGSGRWQRITWDDALNIIAVKVLELRQRYNSNLSLALNKYSGNFGILHHAVEGMFNGLGATTQAVGSPCWSAGLDANFYDFGSSETSDPSTMENAKLIILWGVNPAWTAVHSIPYIYNAQAKGAKVIVIDPIYTTTARKADYYVQIRPGSDNSLALALGKIIVERGFENKSFLKHHSYGWREFKSYLNHFNMDEAANICGQKVEVISFLADLIGQTKPAFIWTGFGLQRHINGGQTIRSINALSALTGNIGIIGGGVNFAHQSTWKFNYNILNNKDLSTQAIRQVDINDFANALNSLNDPPVKLLWISCRNLLTQDPRNKMLNEVLKSLELIVTVDHFITPTAECSNIVLPATTHFEELDVVPSYWHHWIGINQQAIKPYYESKSDLEIAQLFTKKLNELSPNSSTFPTEGTASDFIELEFNEKMDHMLGINHWTELNFGPKKAHINNIAWQDHIFSTPSSKFEFFSQTAKYNGLPPIATYKPIPGPPEKYPFWLITPHSQHGLNSQFQNLEWMLKVNPEPLIYINPQIAQEKELQSGETIKIFNEHGQVLGKIKISSDVSPDTILCFQNWFPNNDFNVNCLNPGHHTDMGKLTTGSNGLALYDVFVNIEKIL
jgi:anaerobic selenocysteine-containing dehydrogenase